MRAQAVAVLAVALALGACGRDQAAETDNAAATSDTRAAEAGGSERFVNPGRWEQRATLVGLDVPGMPADLADGMRRAIGTAQNPTVCITPEEARNPREDFFAGKQKNCRYENFRWGGGKIDVRMRCGEGGITQALDLTGSYTPESYSLNLTARGSGEASGAVPQQNITMRMRVDARRVGQCTGNERA